jgi:hypothetical protein
MNSITTGEDLIPIVTAPGGTPGKAAGVEPGRQEDADLIGTVATCACNAAELSPEEVEEWRAARDSVRLVWMPMRSVRLGLLPAWHRAAGLRDMRP